ncbi:hypothetical protein PAERUG_P48_London_17_VIM_2_01_13_04085 [Pseudomonas aeruginosa]|nr:hypothetical protein PAERUG_P48_London_17_VIM_2_01_13_04085 [Pseudomonas aeruginosa]
MSAISSISTAGKVSVTLATNGLSQVWMTVSMAPIRIRPWVLAPVSSDCFSACMVSIIRSA